MRNFDISLRQGRLQEQGKTIFKNLYIHLNEGSIEAVFTSSVEEIDALIALLAGKVCMDEGYIYLQGKRENLVQMQAWFKSNVKAIDEQDVLIKGLSIADNFIVCSEEKQPFWSHDKRNAKIVQNILRKFSLDIDIQEDVSALSFRQNFQLMLVKSFFHNKKIVLIDRRWMILSEQDMAEILKTIRLLKQSGMSFVLLGFDINNIIHITDRITVVQNGITLFKEKVEKLTDREKSRLKKLLRIQYTVGEITSYTEKKVTEKQIVLKLEQVCAGRLRNVNFQLSGGELVVIYTENHELGLEFYNMLKGKMSLESGTIKVKNRPIQTKGAVDVRVRDGVQCVGMPTDDDFFIDSLKGWENFALKKGMVEGDIWSHGRMQKHLKEQLDNMSEKSVADAAGEILTKGEKLMIRLRSQLLEKPVVLICMEPFSYIDNSERKHAEQLFNMLTAKQVGVVIITNFIEKCENMKATEYMLDRADGLKEYNSHHTC